MGELSEIPSFELLADYVDGLLDHQSSSRIAMLEAKSEETAMVIAGIRHYYSLHGDDREGLEAYLDGLTITFKETVKNARNSSFYTNRPIFRIAAVLLVLVASIAAFYLSRPASGGSDTLIQSYLSDPYRVPSIDRDNGVVLDTQKAYMAYSLEDYDSAINILEGVAVSDTASDLDLMVLGLSYLYKGKALGQPEPKAINMLSRVVEGNNPLIVQQGRWFLALALLQNDDQERAIGYLDGIVGSEKHFKKQEAQQLLSSLKKQ